MKLSILICCLSLSSAISLYQKKLNEARVCQPNPQNEPDSKYTGSRIDRQIILSNDKVMAIELHLSVCNKGSLVSKFVKDESIEVLKSKVKDFVGKFDEVIPWNQTLCEGSNSMNNCFKLARRKSYALRPISIFNPGDFVGGLFKLGDGDEFGKLKDSIDENFTPIGKLIADSIHNQWLEVNKDSNIKIYHIPLLYTPNIESGLGAMKVNADGKIEQWFSLISATENYTYSPELKNQFKNSINLLLNQVKNVVKNANNKLKSLNSQLSDSKPIRKSIKSMGLTKTVSFLNFIFKDKIEDLSKLRFNKEQVDFDTIMVFSQILTKEQFGKFLNNLNSVYNRFQVSEQMFTYPKLTENII